MNEILSLFLTHKSSIIVILIAIIIEITAKTLKNKNKKIILEKYGESVDQENGEFYLQYYKKNQALDFTRVITMILMIMSLIIINTDINWGFFSVATGAVIIAFKDFILSVIAFFFVTPSFPIGTTVRIGNMQGQIIFIRMLSVGILGKDKRGEASGELFLIPSHKFITDVVQKEELHSNSIFKDFIEIPYVPEKFDKNFEEFLASLREFLQNIFPVRNANNVGNFNTYIGHRYKLNFYFHDDDYWAVQVRFVGTAKQIARHKEQIMLFVDKEIKREKPAENPENAKNP